MCNENKNVNAYVIQFMIQFVNIPPQAEVHVDVNNTQLAN